MPEGSSKMIPNEPRNGPRLGSGNDQKGGPNRLRRVQKCPGARSAPAKILEAFCNWGCPVTILSGDLANCQLIQSNKPCISFSFWACASQFNQINLIVYFLCLFSSGDGPVNSIHSKELILDTFCRLIRLIGL